MLATITRTKTSKLVARRSARLDRVKRKADVARYQAKARVETCETGVSNANQALEAAKHALEVAKGTVERMQRRLVDAKERLTDVEERSATVICVHTRELENAESYHNSVTMNTAINTIQTEDGRTYPLMGRTQELVRDCMAGRASGVLSVAYEGYGYMLIEALDGDVLTDLGDTFVVTLRDRVVLFTQERDGGLHFQIR